MDDRWTRKLSDYLDDELTPAQRAEVEAELARSAELRAVLEALERVARAAQSLDDRPPARDLWPGIARGIGVAAQERWERKRRLRIPPPAYRASLSMLQLAAAAVVVMLVSAGGAWFLKPAASPVSPVRMSNSMVRAISVPGDGESVEYQRTIDDMLRALEEGRDVLDSATIRTIEESLITIDRAIQDAEWALAEDTSSVYLNSHLARAMRQKFDLLRGVNQMISAARL